MRLPKLFVLALLLAPPAAVADENNKGGPSGKGGGAAKPESLEDILQQAANAGERPPPEQKAAPVKSDDKKPAAAAAATKAAVATAVTAKDAKAAPGQPAQPAHPAEPQPPPTDDNDTTGEAAAPKPLQAVQGVSAQARKRGPYELSPLDCRVLDGAGIERLLPGRVISGEEPDILCRVVVTQPGTVASLPHDLTLVVNVGKRETFRQTRNVRISSVGRRALVFVIPADKISSDDSTQVKIQALLSAPSAPPNGRLAQFLVESID